MLDNFMFGIKFRENERKQKKRKNLNSCKLNEKITAQTSCVERIQISCSCSFSLRFTAQSTAPERSGSSYHFHFASCKCIPVEFAICCMPILCYWRSCVQLISRSSVISKYDFESSSFASLLFFFLFFFRFAMHELVFSSRILGKLSIFNF